MTDLVTISEAAGYLGVSKATLRNWDREGKLPARRHPLNDYRCYHIDDLRRLREQLTLMEEEPPGSQASSAQPVSDSKAARRLVSRLHAALRNHDGDSNLLQRFDELTKLLFVKLMATGDFRAASAAASGGADRGRAQRWRTEYSRLVNENAQWVPGRFRTLNCSEAALEECSAILESVYFDGSSLDVKGLAYEEVIKGTFDKSDNQQFFTPPQIVSFMVEMLRADLNGTVMDPACGTAGFLVELHKQASSGLRPVGIEVDERLAWVSAINLLAHGSQDFEVLYVPGAGSLGGGIQDFEGRVDAILTNPPFGSDLSDPDLLRLYELGGGRQSRRRGILFLEKCQRLLREGGLLAIILDEGVLNLSSATDVRRFILRHFEILSIVSLPDTAFLPYASVAASILVLRKSSSGHPGTSVFFARAEAIGRRPNGDEDVRYEANGIARQNSDLPEILSAWRAFRLGASLAPTELSYTAYISTQLCESVDARLDFRFHHPSREDSSRLLGASRFPLVALSDLCEEVSETVIPSTSLADEMILYTGLAHIESRSGVVVQEPTAAASLKSAVKAYAAGDILFARMRPGLRKIAHVTFPGGGYCSPECVVLRVRRAEDGSPVFEPELLAAVLRSDLVFGQILHLVAGIGRPRLNASDLRRVQVPLPPKSVQHAVLQQHRAHLLSAQELKSQAVQLNARAAEIELAAVDALSQEISGGPLG